MSLRAAPVVAALLLAACPGSRPVPEAAAAAQSPAVSVFLTSELKGYVGPCGCSENMRGGIARIATELAQARAAGEHVVYLDSGDALFAELAIPEAAVPQQERKARTLAQAMQLMGLSLRGRGPLDDARGAGFRKGLALPELPASGLATVPLPKGTLAVVEADDVATLADRGHAARKGGAAFVLGLVHTSLEAALREAPALAGSVDVAVAVKARDALSGEQNRLVRGGVPLVQVQTKGRSLLKLELHFGGEGPFVFLKGSADLERELAVLDQRIEMMRAQVNEPMLAAELMHLKQAKLAELTARREALAATPLPLPRGRNVWSLRFVPIESTVPEDPRAKDLVTAYDRDVGLLNVAWAKEHGKPCPAPGKGEAAYVGNGPCFDCHDDSFAGWDASKHSHGYQTLEKVGKQHHLDCIGCHVTGWQQPGGVCRIDQTKDRQGIGCESCHGPSSVHLEDPTNDNVLKGNTAKVCTGCHDRENSPHFDFDRYLKEIIVPGHGLPVAKKPRPDAGTRG